MKNVSDLIQNMSYPESYINNLKLRIGAFFVLSMKEPDLMKAK